MSSLFCIVPEKSPEAGSLPMPKLPGSRKNPNAKKSSRRTLAAGGSNLFIFIDYSMG